MTVSENVIKATSFSASAHACGPVLTILQGNAVAANVRLDIGMIWLLQRALHDVLAAQAKLEERVRAVDRP
jgi:hypothetical protein